MYGINPKKEEKSMATTKKEKGLLKKERTVFLQIEVVTNEQTDRLKDKANYVFCKKELYGSKFDIKQIQANVKK
jgi:hypothetical protein